MSTEVTARAERPITVSSFTDLVPYDVLDIRPLEVRPDGSWSEDITVYFDAESLTTKQFYEVRRRIRTTPEGEAREIQAINAYKSVNTYLAIGAPNNSQVVGEVRLLSQIVQGLILMSFPEAAQDLGVTF